MKKKLSKSLRILITGASGFLGSHLVDALRKKGYLKLFIPRSKDFDLRVLKNCTNTVKNIDIVIHLAAKVGGIGLNQKIPAEMFYDNLIMGTQLMHEAWKIGVKKYISIGTICAYPKFTPIPFLEENLWNGYPEETNAPYGLAKKMGLVQAQAYREQYGFNAIYLLPVNLYGPGDNFNPESSHVIPALIDKIYKAKIHKQSTVTIWGTGKATREFLYVEDAAEAIILAMEKYNKGNPVNIGSGFEISIRQLVQLLVKNIGFNGKIIWDITKPDGQPKRKLDTKRAYKEFGFQAHTTFVEGLQKEIEWYEKNILRK
jgi:GDP-L-fucose synthase